MKVGTMDLPISLIDNGFDWFQLYYDQVCKGIVPETAEEAFVILGGKLPPKVKVERLDKEVPKKLKDSGINETA